MYINQKFINKLLKRATSIERKDIRNLNVVIGGRVLNKAVIKDKF